MVLQYKYLYMLTIVVASMHDLIAHGGTSQLQQFCIAVPRPPHMSLLPRGFLGQNEIN